MLRARLPHIAVVAALTLTACSQGRPAAVPAIRIGALFPLTGPLASLAREEYAGVAIARDAVNADGGVAGRPVELVDQELDTAAAAPGAVASLASQGVSTIIGTYSSSLSIPASAAAAGRGITYWEAGAVADQVTGRGLPLVFRVGASGGNLGENSGRFAIEQLAPRLARSARDLRVSVVLEDDDYGRSVAGAAIAAIGGRGGQIVSRTSYNAYAPAWQPVLDQVVAAHPDILILASYIPDGVAFRRAMLAAHVRVAALIGSTMAECGPEFGEMLGADAVGVFASDRPTSGFNPAALDPTARLVYRRFASAWGREHAGAQPTEEGLAGFSAAWALFHHVLPGALTLDSAGIATAARTTKLPEGSLPNGAGLDFAADPGRLGQNLDAAAVLWQWQAVRHSVTVWPPAYATGAVAFVPLPR